MPKLKYTQSDDDTLSEFNNIEIELSNEATIHDIMVAFQRLCLAIGYQQGSFDRAVQQYFNEERHDIMDFINEIRDQYVTTSTLDQ